MNGSVANARRSESSCLEGSSCWLPFFVSTKDESGKHAVLHVSIDWNKR